MLGSAKSTTHELPRAPTSTLPGALELNIEARHETHEHPRTTLGAPQHCPCSRTSTLGTLPQHQVAFKNARIH